MKRQRHAVAEPAPSYGRRALITKQVDVGRVEDLLSPRPAAAPTPKPPADPFDQQPWPKGLGRISSIISSKMAAFNPPEPSESCFWNFAYLVPSILFIRRHSSMKVEYSGDRACAGGGQESYQISDFFRL